MKLTYQDLLEKMTNMEMLAIPPEKERWEEISQAMTGIHPMILQQILTVNGEQTEIVMGISVWKKIVLWHLKWKVPE